MSGGDQFLLERREEALDAVAAALNSRPRKTLGYKTPAEALNERLLPLGAATA